MQKLMLVCAVCLAVSCAVQAQLQIRKVTEPAGKTLDKALKASSLTQAGAKPFHLKLQITATKGDPTVYQGTVEETWFGPNQWRRVISGPGVTETIVMDAGGTRYAAEGEYLPNWLRNYATALFDPVPDASKWNLSKTPLEHIEMPNGSRSNPCQHAEFMLGTAQAQQINFANVCFRPDGLLDFVGSPNYAMEFHDYAPFGKLKVAHTLIEDPMRGVNLKGTIVTLDPASGSASDLAVPANATATESLASMAVSSTTIMQLAGSITFQWPNPIPGNGMFTAWVWLDRTGKIREARPLNSDESGIAADMTAQLLGRQWKSPTVDGKSIQVQGAFVVKYPPEKP